MQETEEIKLPATGKTVLIRGYVTGLIDREVKKIKASANKATYEVDGKQIDPQDTTGNKLPEGKMVMVTDPSASLTADEKLVELMVLAVDGNNGDAYKQLMQLPNKDVNCVFDRVKALYAEGEVEASDPKAPSA